MCKGVVWTMPWDYKRYVEILMRRNNWTLEQLAVQAKMTTQELEKAMTIPDFKNISPIINQPTNERETQVALKSLIRLGVTKEFIAEKLEKNVGWVEQIIEGQAKSRVYHRQEQIDCPKCGCPVITPYTAFVHSCAPSTHSKEGPCIHCGCQLRFVIDSDINVPIKVLELGPVILATDEQVKPYLTNSPSVRPTTPIYYRCHRSLDNYRYEVAAGFCIMGSNQQPSSVGSCPFDPNFEDNKFVEIGETFDEAMKNLVKSFEQTAEGLFA